MAGHRGYEYQSTGKAIAHQREVQLAEPEVLLPSTVHVLVRGRVAPDRVSEAALTKMHGEVAEMRRRVQAIDQRSAERVRQLELATARQLQAQDERVTEFERSTSEELRTQSDRMQALKKEIDERLAVLEAKVK